MSRTGQISPDKIPLKRLRLDKETIQKLQVAAATEYDQPGDDLTGRDCIPEPPPPTPEPAPGG